MKSYEVLLEFPKEIYLIPTIVWLFQKRLWIRKLFSEIKGEN
jgi:hypothetical protein